VTNGTAVLGLGDIGPAGRQAGDGGQGRPVQEVRRHRRVRHRDQRETRPGQAGRHHRALEPTFGGINLEDIKAPDCFYVERKLRERMKIPVFHDDQHGTAIVVGAALLNGLKVVART
jgi:malate dehydrogenase (oxaloacetate-decarboxylating)(NADP+)